MGPKQTETSQVVERQQLRQKIMQEYHDGHLAGHFSGPRLYKTLVQKWWRPHMYTDAMNYANSCPQCVIVEGTGRRQKPLLQPIVTEHPFQIVGVDIMELPVTNQGNRYAIVFQDLFTKLPLVFPTIDQKAERIAQLLVEEIVPTFGVPETILTDRGANLLSFLMKDVCKLLGSKKLNTTASHHSVMVQWRDLTEPLSQCYGSKLLRWEHSGTNILVESSGYIGIHPTVSLEKSHPIYSLDLNVAPQHKQPYCQPSHLK